MTNKKRLEEIKLKFNNTVDAMLYVPHEDVKFLIKQAERVQELEKQNKRYCEYLRLIKATGTYGKDISTGEIIRSDEANLAEEALEGKE